MRCAKGVVGTIGSRYANIVVGDLRYSCCWRWLLIAVVDDDGVDDVDNNSKYDNV